jgi:UDP-N-acetylglucosamine acyltransferase
VSEDAQKLLKQAHRLLYREGLTTRRAVERMEKELDPAPEMRHLVDFLKRSTRGITK